MSLQKSELVEKNQYELTFTIDHDTFEAAVQRAYKKQAAKITIPGFRRGKAPRSIIEKMYGKGVFYEDALNDVMPAAYEDAAKESALDIVSRPEIDVDTIDENGVVIKAKVFVKPEVTIEGYKGITATKRVKPVTDEDVDAEIKTVQQRNSRTIEVTDRNAQMDDTVTIDYAGSIDGKPFDGGSAEGHELKLGSGSFIPGFEEQLVGHSIGEEFDITVKFPDDYHAEELKGKEAVFHINLKAIKMTELPALDDEFAKDVSDFDTFEEYKADIRKKQQERNEKAADSEVEDEVMKKVIELLQGDIPECMFEAETENQVRDFDNRLRMQGLDLKTYFQYTGLDLDKMREQMRPSAENQVKLRLALEKIAELEQLEATDEDIEAEYQRMADAYSVEIDKVKEAIAREDVAKDMKVKKAGDLVKAAAIVTDAPYGEEPKDEAAADESADK